MLFINNFIDNIDISKKEGFDKNMLTIIFIFFDKVKTLKLKLLIILKKIKLKID